MSQFNLDYVKVKREKGKGLDTTRLKIYIHHYFPIESLKYKGSMKGRQEENKVKGARTRKIDARHMHIKGQKINQSYG